MKEYIFSIAISIVVVGDADGHDWILPRLQFREVSRTFSSLPFMLPRPDLWPADKQTVVIETFLTGGQNFTVHEYKALFKQVECGDCYNMWKDNWDTLGDVSAPGIPVHCVYSNGVPTTEVRYYDRRVHYLLVYFSNRVATS